MKQNGEDNQRQTTDVGARRVARVYAEALLNAADKRGEADTILEEFQALVHDVFRANPQVETFLSSPAVTKKVKAGVLHKVFEGRSSELFANFLMVLNDHERLDLLRAVQQALGELYDERKRRVRVLVRSAAPLPDDQRQRLEQDLRQAFHLEPVLETHVEPELLGGLTVRVGDWQYDASLRTQLNAIRNQILARSSHEIQSGRDRFSSAAGN